MEKAAGGDAKALREMASLSHEAAGARDDLTGLICLAEALTFSRLAASQGCAKAKGNVAAILYDIALKVSDLGETGQASAFSIQATDLQQSL